MAKAAARHRPLKQRISSAEPAERVALRDKHESAAFRRRTSFEQLPSDAKPKERKEAWMRATPGLLREFASAGDTGKMRGPEEYLAASSVSTAPDLDERENATDMLKEETVDELQGKNDVLSLASKSVARSEDAGWVQNAESHSPVRAVPLRRIPSVVGTDPSPDAGRNLQHLSRRQERWRRIVHAYFGRRERRRRVGTAQKGAVELEHSLISAPASVPVSFPASRIGKNEARLLALVSRRRLRADTAFRSVPLRRARMRKHLIRWRLARTKSTLVSHRGRRIRRIQRTFARLSTYFSASAESSYRLRRHENGQRSRKMFLARQGWQGNAAWENMSAAERFVEFARKGSGGDAGSDERRDKLSDWQREGLVEEVRGLLGSGGKR